MGKIPGSFSNGYKWNEIQVFLQKLNAGGGRYRPLSEAEWEYAAGRAKELGLVGMNPPEYGESDKWEWVQDCYHHTYQFGAPSDGRAWETGPCVSRVTRGGRFFSPWEIKGKEVPVHRGSGNPSSGMDRATFRLARSLP